MVDSHPALRANGAPNTPWGPLRVLASAGPWRWLASVWRGRVLLSQQVREGVLFEVKRFSSGYPTQACLSALCGRVVL